jgi:predicted acetyltransferase
MASSEAFAFHNPAPLTDGDLTLVLIDRMPGNPARNWLPSYHFAMRHTDTGERLGHIDLRIGMTPHLLRYGGNIGYEVLEKHQGHRYAARSCRLLLPLARDHGMAELWITCDVDNIASRRTAERAGFALVDVIPLREEDHPDAYAEGRRFTCRYRLLLGHAPSEGE